MKVALWVIAALSSNVVHANAPWGTAGPSRLPQGWSEHMDPSSNQPYYYNAVDGTTTWDRPSLEAPSPSNETTINTSDILNAANPQPESKQSQQEVELQPETTVDGATAPSSTIPTDESEPATMNQDANINTDGSMFPPGSPEGESSSQTMPEEPAQREEQNESSPPSASASFDRPWEQQPQQRDPRGWNVEQPPQQQSLGPWGMPPPKNEQQQQQQPGWNLNNRRPMEEETAKQPILVDDRRHGAEVPRPEQQTPDKNQAFDPMQQRPGMQPPQTQGGSWRGQPQAPPGYQGFPPQQQQGPPQQQQQQGPPQQQQQGQQQGSPPQQRGGPPQQQRGTPPPQQQQQRPPQDPNQRPELQRQVPRIPETQPLRPPPGSQYGRGPPNQGYGQYDGSYPGQQYYNPQQQQQQYGSPYNSYGQYSGQELVTQPDQMAGVRDSLGKTWQSVLGFGNRTKEVLSTARETVATNARDAGQTITTKSTGWWGQAKNALGSVFEPSDKGASEYSMTGIYGSGDGLQGNRMPPQGYGGQPYGYSQQQGGRPQNYPPQYQGRHNLPPQPPGRSQMPPPGQQQPPMQQGQQPPQQQGQPPQQGQQPPRPGQQPPQQQGQYPPPGSRYPPGYTPPNPRSDPPYAHQQQQRPGGSQQSQWGLPRGGPDQRPMMEQGRPYGPPPVPGQQQDPNQKSDEEGKKDPNAAWQHPGLGPDGY